MLRLSLILFFFSSTVLGIAQTHYFHKQWDKRYGGTSSDVLYSILKTGDKGYLLGGSSGSAVSGDKTESNWDTTSITWDYWIAKVDSNGLLAWNRRFGGLGQDGLYVLGLTKDNGYVLGGTSYSGMEGNKSEPSRGLSDYWVVKTDAYGHESWNKRFGGSGKDELYALEPTFEGGYLLGGYSYSNTGGDKTESNKDATKFTSDYWIVKIDSAGKKEWDKTIGGKSTDALSSLKQIYDGGFILGGWSSSDSSYDKTQPCWGNKDYWVVRIDSNGEKLWDKRYGLQGGATFYSLQPTNDRGFILCGYASAGINGEKTDSLEGYWVLKIDSNGTKLWDRTFNGSKNYLQQLNCLSVTSDSGYLLTTVSENGIGRDKTENNLGASQTWVIKINSNGYKVWDKTILTNGSDEVGYAIEADDGCYIVCNYTQASIGGYKTESSWGGNDYWIMKFCMDTIRETGIDDRPQNTYHSGIQIQVWPNPFTSDLSIALKGEDIHEASFTITNAMGQVIYKREESNLAAGYTKVLDLSYLPNGVYFVEVGTRDGCSVRQVVKE